MRRSPYTHRRSAERERGFTLLELLIMMAILGILALFSYPAIHKMIVRSQMEGVGREIVTFMRSARLESIKQSVPVVVRMNPATGEFSAFADLNVAGGAAGIDLLFNPVDGAPMGQTDYEVIPSRILGQNFAFGGPASDSDAVTGFGTVGADRVVVFNADGSVVAEGTIRFGDELDNYLQVAVEPRTTARVRILKWDRDNGLWQERGRETGGVSWEWYT